MNRNKWFSFAALAIITLLTACGGSGGGGDDDDPVVASKEQIVISNQSVSFLAEVGEQTINVNANCAWTVTVENGDANWMTVNPKSGVNMGSFTISVTANTTETDRYATLIVAGKTLTRTINVTQRGRETTMTVDVSSLDFSVNGASKTFSITSNGSWTIEAPEWCGLSMKSGSNNKEITVTVGKNETGAERTGEIVVSGQSGKTARISVRQDGGKQPEITNLQLGTPTSNSVDFSFTLTASPDATEYGICYSDTKKSPTVDDSKVSGTLTNGEVKGTISGLEQNKTYYVRAYAKNTLGTTYSEAKEFKTTQNIPGSGDNNPPTP